MQIHMLLSLCITLLITPAYITDTLEPPPDLSLDGRPVSITEDQIVAGLDDRRGVIKSPSVEQEREISTSKQEAFLMLAAQMDDLVPEDQQVEPPESPGTRHQRACTLLRSK